MGADGGLEAADFGIGLRSVAAYQTACRPWHALTQPGDFAERANTSCRSGVRFAQESPPADPHHHPPPQPACSTTMRSHRSSPLKTATRVPNFCARRDNLLLTFADRPAGFDQSVRGVGFGVAARLAPHGRN